MDYNKQSSLEDLKDFISFLKREGAFSSFLKNKIIYHSINAKNMEDIYKTSFLIRRKLMIDSKISSFDWFETDEGGKYWGNVNYKWIHYVKA